MSKKAVVFLSGGVDSTTCLAIAKSQGFECYALTFDYGQRNRIEIDYAKKIADTMGVADHQIFTLNLAQWGGSALTDHALDMSMTYVPGRNTVFLSLGLAYAETLGAHDLFFGPNADDYANYSDCRPEYLNAFQQLIALTYDLTIHTPLLYLNKASIVHQGLALGVDYNLTFSCYNPTPDGAPCCVCDACFLRSHTAAD